MFSSFHLLGAPSTLVLLLRNRRDDSLQDKMYIVLDGKIHVMHQVDPMAAPAVVEVCGSVGFTNE